jgi:hypothetical protein
MMHKSEIRELRKRLAEAKRKASECERRAEGVSEFIRDYMLKAADEHRRTAHSLAQRLGTRA